MVITTIIPVVHSLAIRPTRFFRPVCWVVEGGCGKGMLRRGLGGKELRKLVRAHQLYARVREDVGCGVRKPLVPEDVTENLVRMYIDRVEGRECWWGKAAGVSGDLMVVCGGQASLKVEVKGFTNGSGPLTFGPKNRFDELWFVDAHELVTARGLVKLYKAPLAFESSEIQAIRVNRKERFADQCVQGRRPKVSFQKFVSEVGEENVQLVYEGVWNELCNC